MSRLSENQWTVAEGVKTVLRAGLEAVRHGIYIRIILKENGKSKILMPNIWKITAMEEI